jgi:hypothetical protein
MSRHPRRAIAQQTVEVIDHGSYVTPSGRTADISGRSARAVDGTRVYRPAELETLLSRLPPSPALPTRIEVTEETTLEASLRSCSAKGRSPGGSATSPSRCTTRHRGSRGSTPSAGRSRERAGATGHSVT